MNDDKNVEGARRAARSILEAAKRGGAFSKESGCRLFREDALRALECAASDPQGASRAVELAFSGDQEARIAVHTAIASFMATDQPIPVALRPYLLQLLDYGEIGPKNLEWVGTTTLLEINGL